MEPIQGRKRVTWISLGMKSFEVHGKFFQTVRTLIALLVKILSSFGPRNLSYILKELKKMLK